MDHQVNIVVSSEACKKENPSFTHSNFAINFLTSIPLSGACKIGLTEIFYTPVKNLFGYSNNDNAMVVEKDHEQDKVCTLTKTGSISTDITNFNLTAEKEKLNVSIHQLILNDKIHYEIKTTYAQGFAIRLSETFKKVMGFDFSIYYSKEVVAENPYNDSVYRSLEEGETYTFEIIKLSVPKLCFLDEPDEKSVSGLVSSFNLALINREISDIKFKQNDEQIEMETDATDYRVYLSNKLKRILGTTETYISKGFKSQRVDCYRGSKKILLKTNIIEPQIRNTKRENVLRIVDHKHQSDEDVHAQVQSVLYCPLVRAHELTSIHVDIVDESGDYIPFEEDVIIVLSLRPI